MCATSFGAALFIGVSKSGMIHLVSYERLIGIRDYARILLLHGRDWFPNLCVAHVSRRNKIWVQVVETAYMKVRPS